MLRRVSFYVEFLFVRYLTVRIIDHEHEIRVAEPACREDGGRNYAVGLTGKRPQEVAHELRDRSGRPFGTPRRLAFCYQRLRGRKKEKSRYRCCWQDCRHAPCH